jgi:hypothetical protein
MSRNPESRSALCGNCEHFVAGGLCELVKGQVNAKSICDLHAFGDPKPIDTEVDPKYKKTDVNYKPGFFAETVTGDLVEKAIQMEHELLSRGISEEEVHRAVIAYFSEPEPPQAMPWPGPVTGLDLAGRIDPFKVFASREPLTDFRGLPPDVQPYPTPNKSPYGIGGGPQPYRSNPTPDPNSLGSLSNTYDVLNPPYPYDSPVWYGLANRVNSEPSMHGEHGFNVAKAIPEWRYDVEQSQTYPPAQRDIILPPSGALLETIDPKELQAGIEIELEHTENRDIAKQIAIDHLNEDPKYYTKLLTHVEPEKKHLLETRIREAKKDDTKKKLLSLMAKWALLLGGMTVINKIIKDYIDSDTDKPLEIIAVYQYHGHDNDDPCKPYGGKRFNLLETHNRPVIPSEKLGYTTTHPNCICTWDVRPDSNLKPNKITKSEQGDITKIEKHITNAAKKGKLHKVEADGHLSKKTTKKNPLKEGCSCSLSIPPLKVGLSRRALQEAMTNLRHEFNWLSDDYVNSAVKLSEDSGGKLYLVRAASESITDHRGEGEPYRRKLSADELSAMTRTAIGKKMDVNHQPEFETDATILDAEFHPKRREIQMLVIEKDPEINQAIEDGKITAVSINGGMPRNESIEPCNHGCETKNCELCVVPKGVVLGELDDIAMTWVVTDPNGLYWNGHFVPSAEPGIKVTKIEAL